MPQDPATARRPAAPVALRAAEAPPRARRAAGGGASPGRARKAEGRETRPLGDPFGPRNCGVNLARPAPGAASAPRHAHGGRDGFVSILEGTPTLLTDAGETPLAPGICAGFRAGTGGAHCLVSRGATDVLNLEIGDRAPGDRVTDPDDDLRAEVGAGGKWRYSHRDGTPL